jgi:uncharacterized Zn finger protein
VIPRKVAKNLLAEFLERLVAVESVGGYSQILRTREPAEVADDVLKESILVLRGAENVEQKGRRYLVEGRICVEQIRPDGLIVASARGTGEDHRLGYDPVKRQWRCTCRAGSRGRCSHLVALRLVVAEPVAQGGTR